jgi:hypothetical protein
LATIVAKYLKLPINSRFSYQPIGSLGPIPTPTFIKPALFHILKSAHMELIKQGKQEPYSTVWA